MCEINIFLDDGNHWFAAGFRPIFFLIFPIFPNSKRCYVFHGLLTFLRFAISLLSPMTEMLGLQQVFGMYFS